MGAAGAFAAGLGSAGAVDFAEAFAEVFAEVWRALAVVDADFFAGACLVVF